MAAGVAEAGADADKARRFRDAALPHLDDVYTLARYLMRSAADADDAVQECYLRAFRHFDGFRGQATKPWLMAILRNVCRAEFARRAGAAGEPAELGEDALPLWQEPESSPEAAILRQRDAADGAGAGRGAAGAVPGGDRAARHQRSLLPGDRRGGGCPDRDRDVAPGACAQHAARGLAQVGARAAIEERST